MGKAKKTSMKIVNEHCAGIDVGSRSHYVAIGQTDKDVKEFGVYAQDLTDLCNWQIPGVSHSTILSVMSEIGPKGFMKFSTAKHFASWLRLAPNNKISGGKTLSNRIPKGSNRLKIALRNAANAVGNLKESDLGRFFNKIAFKKGRQAAITATARKIAVILWNMVTKKVQYQPKTAYIFLDEKRKQLALIRKKIAKFGLDPNELGIFSQERYRKNWELKHINNQ